MHNTETGRYFAGALQETQRELQRERLVAYKRRVSLGDLITDRWANARECGFGEKTSMYDSVLVLGDVKVGTNCWIGPGVILDGSGGGLIVGDFCSIAANVGIYTHNSVKWATSMGKAAYEQAPTKIGSGVYIGPNATIEKGVTIGDRCVIGAHSLVQGDVPSGMKAWGTPAKVIGPID